MKNAFGEEMDRQIVVSSQNKSWPIRLAMKFGAKNKAQANLMLALVAIVLIIIAFSVIKAQPSFETIKAEDMSDAQLQELINRGINTDDLTPEQKRELEKRGINF